MNVGLVSSAYPVLSMEHFIQHPMTTYTRLDIYNVDTLLDPIKPLTVLEWVTCGFCTGDLKGVRVFLILTLG